MASGVFPDDPGGPESRRPTRDARFASKDREYSRAPWGGQTAGGREIPGPPGVQAAEAAAAGRASSAQAVAQAWALAQAHWKL